MVYNNFCQAICTQLGLEVVVGRGVPRAQKAGWGCKGGVFEGKKGGNDMLFSVPG